MDIPRISTVQALLLGIASIAVTGHLLFIPIVLSHSGRDCWLALLAAAIPSLFVSVVVALLAKRFPGQTIVEYSKSIAGKWVGGVLGLLFIFYFFHDATLSIRGFGEFFTSAITPRTPIVIYFSAIVILAVYAVRCGIEVISRTNQMFLFCIVPVGILASIMTHKDKDYRNFLPILEYGPEPMMMGALSLLSLFSSFLVLSMVFPSVNDGKKLLSGSMICMGVLIIMFIGPITGPIAIYGAERSIGITFPTFQILRDIRVGELQRLDLLGIMLWSLGSFGKISLYLFATTVGIAQLTGVRNHKVLAGPVGTLMVIVALINSKNFLEIFKFYKYTYPYYSTFFGIVLPTLLLIVAIVRRKGIRRKGAARS
jgi:spore germination protein KB